MSFEPEPEPDRRRVPDVFSYRLGKVEEKASKSEAELLKLERLVNEFIVAMPHNYTPRSEFEQLVEKLTSLSQHLETYVATANASNAIRERNAIEQRTVRLQWPVWVLMFGSFAVSIVSLIAQR